MSWGNLFLISVPLLLLTWYTYSYFQSPEPVGLEYEVHITRQNEVMRDHAWLYPIFTFLTDEGKEEQQARERPDEEFRIVTVTTESFGRGTRSLPTSPFQVEVSTSDTAFRVAGGYAFRKSGPAAGMAYRPLTHTRARRYKRPSVEEWTGSKPAMGDGVSQPVGMEFMVPASGPHDSLFFIIRLATTGGKEFPAETDSQTFNSVVKLEVHP